MIQLELPIPQPNVPALNLNGMVYRIFCEAANEGKWITFYEIQREVHRRTGDWHSDSGISARKRDLSKAQYGGHQFEKRIREGTKSYEYRLTGGK